MRGADSVRDRIRDLLAEEMPRKTPLLREAWSVSTDELPDVDEYVSGDLSEEILNGGRGKAWVVVVNPRLLRTVRTGDFSALAEPEYHSRYACRVYIWSLANNWDEAVTSRDLLAVCARLSLLQYPTLSTAGGDTNARINEGTYTEDFGVPVRTGGTSSRTWAGAILTVEIDVEEVIDDGSTLPAIGTADQVTPTGYAVGPPQPLVEGASNGA